MRGSKCSPRSRPQCLEARAEAAAAREKKARNVRRCELIDTPAASMSDVRKLRHLPAVPQTPMPTEREPARRPAAR
jgi:hypothetical protein